MLLIPNGPTLNCPAESDLFTRVDDSLTELS